MFCKPFQQLKLLLLDEIQTIKIVHNKFSASSFVEKAYPALSLNEAVSFHEVIYSEGHIYCSQYSCVVHIIKFIGWETISMFYCALGDKDALCATLYWHALM